MSNRLGAPTLTLAVVFGCAAAASTQATNAPQDAANAFRSLPDAWAGEWDGVELPEPVSADLKDLEDTPAHDKTDQMVKSRLTPSARTKMEATSYDDAPGSLCDPEGWFPFLNYGYGFALLASPGKITMVPVEADTEGVRRIYMKPAHRADIKPSWNGDSIARWEGNTLVIDTIGFNDLSWLGDDREPHTTALHLVERMRLVHGQAYLQVEDTISDPQALTAPYKLTRYFSKYNASHIGAGPDRNMMELVCNEDPSPFLKGKTGAVKAPGPQ